VISQATVVVDSSVIAAIFRKELDAAHLVERVVSYRRRVVSAANWLESAMVCEGKSELGAAARFDGIVDALRLEIIPVNANQARIGRTAFRKFGKGRSRASLSFGDCFAYALAKDLPAPLLFKGNDFIHTDIARA
jgi:ribonuclease VapC